MKLTLVLFLVMISCYSWAGPRVVGNGFLEDKEVTLLEKETELLKTKNADDKFGLLNDVLVKYSSEDYIINTSNSQKLKQSAKSLLKLAEKYKSDFNYGNAIHHGNLVLGRVSLFEGNITDAEKYLISASNNKGSPQLASFGPNMTLANELLKKGKKEVVLKYIDACLKFWIAGFETKELTSAWKRTIQSGGIPDFKGNLDY